MIYNITLANAQQVSVNEHDLHDIDVIDSFDGLHLIDRNHSYRIDAISVNLKRKVISFELNGERVVASLQDEVGQLVDSLGLIRDSERSIGELRAPMPGLVLEVLVEPGNKLEAGDPAVVLQAMKMENLIKVPSSHTISEVHVANGESVEKNQKLISFLT